MTGLPYGSTTTFKHLLEDLLKDNIGVDVFFSKYDISAEAHMASNSDDKRLFPIINSIQGPPILEGLACQVHSFYRGHFLGECTIE
jgi:hypothetical protein